MAVMKCIFEQNSDHEPLNRITVLYTLMLHVKQIA